jgi:hypothetical protein
MVEKTAFVDSNKRIINSANSVHNPRKKVYFVRKRGPDGKFVKAYNRVASMRKDGRNIANHKTVPRKIRAKRNNNGMSMNGNLNKLPKYEVTMNSLGRWHKHLFEHFGWMILAKSKGYKYKVATYKKSINEFLRSAKQLFKEYKESNRCHDIKILFKHARVLRTFAKML